MRNLQRQPETVLMTADTVGGIWDYSVELARGLTAAGVRVVLATMGGAPTADQRREAEGIPGLELRESDFRLEWMENPWEDLQRSGEWLLGLRDRVRPDLVHLNGYSHAVLPWGVPVAVVAHSCVASWWRAVRGEPVPPAWDRYREAVTAGLRAADVVVAPTAAMLAALEKEYLPLPRSRVIPNGRSGGLFTPGPKEEFVLTVGRLWDEAKNVAAVGRAAGFVPWPVFVAGEPARPGGVEVPLPGLQRLGRLPPEELSAWYRRAGIYALPARYEPFGLSVLEAALSGCPLVLGDIATFRENWDGVALFVDPDDPEELATVINGLARDASLRDFLGGAARERAAAFTAEKTARLYLELYRELLEEASPFPLRKGTPR